MMSCDRQRCINGQKRRGSLSGLCGGMNLDVEGEGNGVIKVEFIWGLGN
jgi:hypothetical protein